MRRQLALVSLAISSLVVVAFLLPLGILVRNQAENRALTRSERFAESIAAALAVVASGDVELTEDLARAVIDAFGSPAGVSIVFPDRRFVGAPLIESSNLELAQNGAAFTAKTEGGAEVLIPVLLADVPAAADAVVVRAFVEDAELTRGVATAWALLIGLGLFLVLVAVVAADRLGRSVVRPVTELSEAARALGSGDLEVRVEPAGPAEVADVGEAFNFLAERLDALLSAERESVADLSHRLRTPLTALRLQAETLADEGESTSLLADIDRVERAVDRMIEEARRPSRSNGEVQISDLAAIVRYRSTFWKVLADEQGRPVSVHTAGGALPVPLGADELGALVDTVIENVFAHTPPGAGYSISARPASSGGAVLVVEDDGPGLPAPGLEERGESRAGSTGLGLDIVRRTAERTGGGLAVENKRGGGARVEVRFGHSAERRRLRVDDR